MTGLHANGLATLRGQGAMAVVGLAGDDLIRAIEPYASLLSVAVCNGPEMSVVSGDVDAIEQLIAGLAERDVFGRRVRANGAGHSPVVQPVADELRTVLATLRPRPVTVPMYSSVTTAPVAGPELDGAYWAASIREPVLYHQTVQRLCADGYRLFVEMSPNPTLTLPTEQVIGPEGHAVASLRRGRPDPESALEALGALHVYGVPVDLGQFFDRPRPVVSMPSGPWKRTPHWFGPLAAHAHAEVVGQSPTTTADVVRAAFSVVSRRTAVVLLVTGAAPRITDGIRTPLPIRFPRRSGGAGEHRRLRDPGLPGLSAVLMIVSDSLGTKYASDRRCNAYVGGH
ncbi:acyltransferase domain-containing protein [Micromonospora humida]|uniref:acyltransferase domain-containing protein n=1 Tax=Micromonospora humida TaxID=2809018 RepID=UPI003427C41E